MMCGQVLRGGSDAHDLNARAQSHSERPGRPSRRRNRRLNRAEGGASRTDRPRQNRKERRFTGDFTRCLINVGRFHRLSPNRLMGFVNEHYPGRPPEFGRIEIQHQETFFDIDSQAVAAMNTAMAGQQFEGQPVEIVVL